LDLRPYQKNSVAALRHSYATGHQAPILQLATGGGKTVIFAEITAGARAKGRRVLVVAHRRELIRQASAKLTDAGVSHGLICADFPPASDELVQVASVQTVAHRLGQLPAFDLIVVDECHHVRAGQWQDLIESQPHAKLLGVSATPARLDGQGLGTACGGCFDDIVSGPPIAELVRDGYLSPCRIFTPVERLDLRGVRTRAGDYVTADLERAMGGAQIIGSAVASYREHADHLPTIVFCISVAHAEQMAQRFRDAGYRSTCAHGGTPVAERDVAIAGLGNGSIEVLTACDLISEGLDVPVVGAVILLRPTKSLVLFMQQVGRGMRPAPGKQHLVVLDHVGNIAAHSLPDLERVWTLDGVETPEPEVPSELERPHVAQPRFIRETAGKLAELTAANRIAMIRRMPYRTVLGAKLTEPELRLYAQVHGYKPGWVWHRLRAQQHMGRPV
jgi:superfamily II DNA or RNA helicase